MASLKFNNVIYAFNSEKINSIVDFLLKETITNSSTPLEFFDKDNNHIERGRISLANEINKQLQNSSIKSVVLTAN